MILFIEIKSEDLIFSPLRSARRGKTGGKSGGQLLRKEWVTGVKMMNQEVFRIS